MAYPRPLRSKSVSADGWLCVRVCSESSAVVSAKRRFLSIALRIGVSGGLLSCLLFFGGIRDTAAHLMNLPAWYVVAGWAYYLLCQGISAWRWQILLRPMGINVPFRMLFAYYMIGMFVNNFMPGGLVGDLVKSYDLYRYTNQGGKAVLSVVLERFTGLVGLGVLGTFAAMFMVRWPISLVSSGVVAASLVLIFGAVIVLWSKRVGSFVLSRFERVRHLRLVELLRDAYAVVHAYQSHRATILLSVTLSAFLQFLLALYYTLTAKLLGIPVDLYYFVLFLPAITLATLAPISIGGLGIRETVMVLLFASVGIRASDVVAISLAVYAINSVLSLSGGVLLLMRRLRDATPLPPQGPRNAPNGGRS
jgi:uncharacterized protein (TIRG00374 family)